MGNKTTTTKNKTSLPGYLEQTYKGLINAGKAAAVRPLQQYSGPRQAGFTPMQQQAFQLTQNAQGMGIPYLNAASQALSNASASVFPSLQQYNAGNLQQYQDPFQQQVIDSTMANINRSNAVAQQGLKGSGLGAGVSPTLGDRMGLAQAELERNQAMARNQTISGLESQGFQNAQNQFLGQQQLQAGTMGADLSRQLQAGAGFAGLGQQAQDQTYQGIAQLLQQGGQQQQQGQTALDQAYQAFQDRQNYPKSQIEWLANLAYGSPKGSNTTTQQPSPSLLAQLAGLATAGAGLAGNIAKISRGGVARMDAGGPAIAAPMLDQGNFSWSGPQGFSAPPDSPGVHFNTNAGTYINALPSLNPTQLMARSGRKPWITPIPKGILQMLNQIPHFSLADKDLEVNKKARGGGIPHMASGGYGPDFSEFDQGWGTPGKAYTHVPSTVDWGLQVEDPQPPPPPAGVAAMATRTPPPPPGWRPNMQLLMAGLGMMSSSSPYPLQAIGEGALGGLKAAMDLDKNPVVDDSGPTIRVYYPSEHRWEDTGIPSTAYAKLQMQRQLMQQGSQPLTDAEISQYGITPAMVTQKGRPFWKMTDNGRVPEFPGGSGGVTIQNYDPSAPTRDLSKKLSEKEAERWDSIQLQGQKAASIKGNVEALREIAGTVDPSVASRVLAERFPQFSTAGAAFAGVAQGLAPDLRVPGVGSQSDIEYAGALARVGKLSNDPQGNQVLWEIMTAKADLDMARAAVIDRFQGSEQTQADAAQARRDLAVLSQKSILTPRARQILSRVPPDPASGNRAGAIAKFRELSRGKSPEEVSRLREQLRASVPSITDAELGAQ